LADLADAITLPRFGRPDLAVETKPDRTPVTEVDRATETAIRDAVAAGAVDPAGTTGLGVPVWGTTWSVHGRSERGPVHTG
jgi:hypothetical protein